MKVLVHDGIGIFLAARRLNQGQFVHNARTTTRQRGQPTRAPLPPRLPRVDIRHEPDSTTCRCGCERVRIGQDVSEKLDYVPGVFTVERHIRDKWLCRHCETLIQAPAEREPVWRVAPDLECLHT